MSVLTVGIDDGHDGIKIAFVHPQTNELVNYRMPSVAQIGLGDMADAPEYEIDEMTVAVQGLDDKGQSAETIYLIDADRKIITRPMDTRFDGYPHSDLNIALIFHALQKSGVPFQRLYIVSGLPANKYFDKATNGKNSTLIKKKEGSLLKLSRARKRNRPNAFYEVAGVDVMPEGHGVCFNLIVDDEFKSTAFRSDVSDTGFIVLDIGGRTVDLVKIMANMRPRASDLLSYDSGILFLRDEIRSRVSDQLSRVYLSDRRVDEILNTGWHGRPGKYGSADLSAMVQSCLQKHAERIYSEIKGVLSTSDEAMGGLVITGGGSHLLADYLETAIRENGFPYEIIKDVNPEFSNANGFLKFAQLRAIENGLI